MVPLWMSSRLAQRVATARNCAPSDAKQQRGSRTLPAGRGLARAVTLVGPSFRLVPASRRRLAVWPGPDCLGRPGPERLDVTWRCRDLPWETNPSQRPARAQVPADSLRAPARGRSPPNRICAKPSAVSWRAQSRCSSHPTWAHRRTGVGLCRHRTRGGPEVRGRPGRCLTPFQGEARVDQVPPVRLDHGYRFLAASEGSGPQADVVDVMGQRFRKGVDADHPTQAQDPGRRIGNHAAALVVVQEGRQGPKPKP